jgi:hypothetical protein
VALAFVHTWEISLKNYAFILLTIITLNGCSTTSLKKPINNKNIGVHIKYNGPYGLCSEYQGLTVFNNKNGSHTLEENLEEISIKAVSEAISKSNNISSLIPVDEDISYSDLMTFDKWNGNPILNNQGKDYILKLGQTHQVDYVFIALIIDGIECDITISNQYSGFNEVNLYSPSSYMLFDAKKALYLGKAPPVFGQSYALPTPENKEKISNHELQGIINIHYNKTLDYTYRFLTKSKGKLSNNGTK